MFDPFETHRAFTKDWLNFSSSVACCNLMYTTTIALYFIPLFTFFHKQKHLLYNCSILYKRTTPSQKTDWTFLAQSPALPYILYSKVSNLMNVLEGECSRLCLLEISINANMFFVYFVYIYSCNVCFYIFVYLFTTLFMLMFVVIFLFTCLSLFLCWLYFVVVLCNTIICKQFCLLHWFCFCSFCL